MDPTALNELLPGLRRYARLLTGNAWAADDLVQDTLERACRKWLLWQPGTSLRAWLFTVMHRTYLNQRRGADLHDWVDLQDIEATVAAPPSTADMALDLERGLQRLPADQRAVLLLVTVEDLGYAEAAAVLGVPVGTVMSRLSRARDRLRQWMDPATPQPAAAPSDPEPRRLRRLK